MINLVISSLKRAYSPHDLIHIELKKGTTYFHTLGKAPLYMPSEYNGEPILFHSLEGYVLAQTHIDIISPNDYLRIQEKNPPFQIIRISFDAIKSYTVLLKSKGQISKEPL